MGDTAAWFTKFVKVGAEKSSSEYAKGVVAAFERHWNLSTSEVLRGTDSGVDALSLWAWRSFAEKAGK